MRLNSTSFEYFQEKVYKETIEVVGADGPVKIEHLSDLKYTIMVIYETLRLFPPIKYVGRKADDDIDLGKFIQIFARCERIVVRKGPLNVY